MERQILVASLILTFTSMKRQSYRYDRCLVTVSAFQAFEFSHQGKATLLSILMLRRKDCVTPSPGSSNLILHTLITYVARLKPMSRRARTFSDASLMMGLYPGPVFRRNQCKARRFMAKCQMQSFRINTYDRKLQTRVAHRSQFQKAFRL